MIGELVCRMLGHESYVRLDDRLLVLQPQEFDAPVFGPPHLGVRFPGRLVPP
jgi:hypothetical protein